MPNWINLLLIVFVAGLACKTTDRMDSFSAGCITPNGEKIGIGITGKNFILDAESGKVIKDTPIIRKEGAIVCSPQNEVFVVNAEEIINIETSKKYPRRIAGSTIIGINSHENLVGHQKVKFGKQRGKGLEIFVEKPFDQSDDLQPFNLSLEKLGAVQRNKKSFLTKPVKLLEDNRLLVFAGGKGRELPANKDEDLGSDIWGFYKVNLESGEISPTKAIDKSDEVANLFNVPFTDATENGKLVASAFSHTNGKVVFVFNIENGEEVFRNELFRRGENSSKAKNQIKKIRSIALSKDGTKLAIAGEWDVSEGRVYKTQTAITIYDLVNSEQIAEYKFEDKISEILRFGNDELIINNNSKSIAKVNAKDGKNIWITPLSKR